MINFFFVLFKIFPRTKQYLRLLCLVLFVRIEVKLSKTMYVKQKKIKKSNKHLDYFKSINKREEKSYYVFKLALFLYYDNYTQINILVVFA